MVALTNVLTPRQIECMALRYYDGLTYRQIGKALGIGHQAAHRHILKANTRLSRAAIPKPQQMPTTNVRAMTCWDMDRLASRDMIGVA